MLKRSKLNYTFIFVITVISLAAIVLPNNSISIATPNRIDSLDKTLLITVNEYDNEIASKIIEKGPGTAINYTHIDIEKFENITSVLTSINLEEFQSIIFILSEIESNFTDDIISQLDNRITKGVSLSLITSKLHLLNPKLIDLFGLILPSAGTVEYNASEEEVDFSILNDTYSQFPYQFEQFEDIEIEANISIVDDFDNKTTKILQSEFIEEISAESGFFIKLRAQNEGKLLTIPLSLGEETNEEVFELITSLTYYLISWSNEKTKLFEIDNTSNISTDTQNSNQEIITNINNEIITGVVIASGLAVIGGATYKTFAKSASSPKTSNKKDEEIIPSPFPSWILLLLTPVIWLFAQILYPPKLRRLSHNQVIDNEMRAEILDILNFYEFDHFNSLKKQLNSGVSILRWHLQILEDFELIEVNKVNQYKVYHLADTLPNPDRIFLYCSIRSKKAFNIIESLLQNNSALSTKELSQLLHISNDLIKYHSVKLSNIDILEFNALTHKYSINGKYKDNLIWLLERVRKQETDLTILS